MECWHLNFKLDFFFNCNQRLIHGNPVHLLAVLFPISTYHATQDEWIISPARQGVSICRPIVDEWRPKRPPSTRDGGW